MEYPPESIHNLLPREEVRTEKPPRYISKFRATVLQETKLSKDARKTMGPAKSDQPLMGLHSKKDFVRTNVMETTLAEPRKPQPMYADTKRGHRHLLENSGLVPKYINKKDYGETPEYLKQRMEEEQRAQEEYDRNVSDRMMDGAMKKLSEDERTSILGGLKQNWEELNHQYQGLSLVTDTMSKRQHKVRLEQALQQLESDISMLEQYQTIYIA
ncbi:hypothetical protein NHX12_034210 [Muraenolepis orangiensis]|uniref:Enkurin domain-containing protein n=1 Tax=Muraenolepis orangiensis TaxID=630683 RepID=A0A9Q0D399_9TELE|nr:hypothetical protein NHX12_034210 [Muraenolepis orangiensis]